MSASVANEPAAPTVVTSAGDVARLLAEVDSPGPLPLRTLVVPGGRYLHAVRKTLLLAGRADVLAGLAAVTPLELARRILDAAEVDWREREEQVRATRIARGLSEGKVPGGFDEDAIVRVRGWDVAFARAIGELEAAGIRPSGLAEVDDARARGVARLWASLDEDAGQRWTGARVVAEAVARVGQVWRSDGSVLGVVAADTSVVELRLLAAIPGIRIAVQAARPIDEVVLARFERVLGSAAADALRRGPQVAGDSALARLQRDPGAVASGGELDPSLTFEQHEGVDREVDAAARWVAEQVGDGLPLEEIAVLTAEREPYSELLADRIRAACDREPLAVHVAGGLPLCTAMGGGGRLLRLLRALQERLGAEAMWRLLPAVRLAPVDAEERPRQFFSRAEAFSIAYGLGTTGGHLVVPGRARDWPARARDAIARLEPEVAQPEPEGRAQLRYREKQEQLERLNRILPALDALDRAMATVLDDRPLAEIIAALRTLLRDHIQGSTQATNLLFAAVEEQEVPAHATGSIALEYLIGAATHLRVPTGRFGEPAVFVGSIARVSGLRFRAVRIVGLAEGAVPPRARPDVILGQRLREALGLPGRDERAKAVRRRFDAAILSAQERLVLSCPRVVLDRAVRAPSPVFAEAIAAVTGASDPLEQLGEAFRAARRYAQAVRTEQPLRASERLDRAAETALHPAQWLAGHPIGILDIDEATGPADRLSPRDGAVGQNPRWEHPPGLDPAHPISASRLHILLQCPHRSFLTKALHWGEPLRSPEPSALSPLDYGSAIHRCAELFFEAHGANFEGRVGELGLYLAHAEQMVEGVWEELRRTLVLGNDEAWATELARGQEHMRAFLEREWAREPGRWIAAERPFGFEPDPAVRVETPTGPMWLRGYVDRLRLAKSDAGEDIVEVWDVKSGKNPQGVRDPKEPEPGIDLQIGLYTLVARAMWDKWQLPHATAAGYAFTDHAKGPERYFGPERADELADATRQWLSVARGLLGAGLYPRTPVQDDCTFCHFRRACGPGATLRSARLLRTATGPLRAFAVLKGVEVEDGEGAT